MRKSRRQRGPLSLRAAGWAAAVAAFMAASQPNDALRYGPFIAVVAFLLSRPLRIRPGVTEAALAAFLLWAAVSALWTTVPDDYAAKITVYLSLAALFVGVRSAIRWGRNAAVAVAGYVAGAVYGLAQTSLELIAGDGEVYRDAYGRITQVGFLNVNYVAYTTVTAIVLLVLALQTRQVQARRFRWLVYAALALMVIGAFSTGTRGVRVSIAVLVLWLIASRFVRPVRTVIAGCAAAIVAVSFGWANALLETIDKGSRTMTGLSGRLPLWDGARDAWEDRALIGAGLGADRAQSFDELAIHNVVLGLGVTLGAVGLFLFVVFVAKSQTDRIQSLPLRDRRFRVATIMVAFTPIILTSSWEATASGWAGLALLSTPILATAARPAARKAPPAVRQPAPAR